MKWNQLTPESLVPGLQHQQDHKPQYRAPSTLPVDRKPMVKVYALSYSEMYLLPQLDLKFSASQDEGIGPIILGLFD